MENKKSPQKRASEFPVSTAYLVFGGMAVMVGIMVLMGWLLPVIEYLRHFWPRAR